MKLDPSRRPQALSHHPFASPDNPTYPTGLSSRMNSPPPSTSDFTTPSSTPSAAAIAPEAYASTSSAMLVDPPDDPLDFPPQQPESSVPRQFEFTANDRLPLVLDNSMTPPGPRPGYPHFATTSQQSRFHHAGRSRHSNSDPPRQDPFTPPSPKRPRTSPPGTLSLNTMISSLPSNSSVDRPSPVLTLTNVVMGSTSPTLGAGQKRHNSSDRRSFGNRPNLRSLPLGPKEECHSQQNCHLSQQSTELQCGLPGSIEGGAGGQDHVPPDSPQAMSSAASTSSMASMDESLPFLPPILTLPPEVVTTIFEHLLNQLSNVPPAKILLPLAMVHRSWAPHVSRLLEREITFSSRGGHQKAVSHLSQLMNRSIDAEVKEFEREIQIERAEDSESVGHSSDPMQQFVLAEDCGEDDQDVEELEDHDHSDLETASQATSEWQGGEFPAEWVDEPPTPRNVDRTSTSAPSPLSPELPRRPPLRHATFSNFHRGGWETIPPMFKSLLKVSPRLTGITIDAREIKTRSRNAQPAGATGSLGLLQISTLLEVIALGNYQKAIPGVAFPQNSEDPEQLDDRSAPASIPPTIVDVPFSHNLRCLEIRCSKDLFHCSRLISFFVTPVQEPPDLSPEAPSEKSIQVPGLPEGGNVLFPNLRHLSFHILKGRLSPTRSEMVSCPHGAVGLAAPALTVATAQQDQTNPESFKRLTESCNLQMVGPPLTSLVLRNCHIPICFLIPLVWPTVKAGSLRSLTFVQVRPFYVPPSHPQNPNNPNNPQNANNPLVAAGVYQLQNPNPNPNQPQNQSHNLNAAGTNAPGSNNTTNPLQADKFLTLLTLPLLGVSTNLTELRIRISRDFAHLIKDMLDACTNLVVCEIHQRVMKSCFVLQCVHGSKLREFGIGNVKQIEEGKHKDWKRMLCLVFGVEVDRNGNTSAATNADAIEASSSSSHRKITRNRFPMLQTLRISWPTRNAAQTAVVQRVCKVNGIDLRWQGPGPGDRPSPQSQAEVEEGPESPEAGAERTGTANDVPMDPDEEWAPDWVKGENYPAFEEYDAKWWDEPEDKPVKSPKKRKRGRNRGR